VREKLFRLDEGVAVDGTLARRATSLDFLRSYLLFLIFVNHMRDAAKKLAPVALWPVTGNILRRAATLALSTVLITDVLLLTFAVTG
jgi:hypothetical protein